MKLLLDEEVSIEGVNFFGGTMWTDFNGGDLRRTVGPSAQDPAETFLPTSPAADLNW